MTANYFRNNDNEIIHVGERVMFKLDYEGYGKVERIDTRESFMGTFVEVVVAIPTHEHAGFERWDNDAQSYVVNCDTTQVWKTKR